MENATCGKRNFNDVTSPLHGRLPEYPIAQRFLEIGFEISACANSVYQAFLLPLLKRLGTRLGCIVQFHKKICRYIIMGSMYYRIVLLMLNLIYPYDNSAYLLYYCEDEIET